MTKKSLELPPDAHGRLDRAIADRLGIGRASVKQAFAAGAVRVGGRRARASDAAAPGTPVEIELDEAAGPPVAEPAFPLRVLAESPRWLVVDKPAGVATHPLRAGETGTLANAVVARHPECAEASPEPRDGGAVQRLDVETSGCVLFARDRAAWMELHGQLSARAVDKVYLALVAGRVAAGGVCSVRLAQRGGRAVAVPDPDRPPRSTSRPRPAETRWEVRRGFASHTLLEVRIATGVMHQIRAHLAYVGHPVAGDVAYGGAAAAAPELGRHFLHAWRLGFERPEGGHAAVESPLPPDLDAFLARLAAA